MPALYQDYRPQKFSEIIGQDYIKKTLQNAVANGTFAHAYLFTGTRGTGKTSTARIFARAINSPLKDGEPDNSTAISKAFLDGSSLDLVEIDAASNTGVENIREIIEGLKFSPSSAKYKVFIIDEVHMLSKGAFNALLKTLEEPPKHAVFILATTEIQKVPATVVSRTQRFDFKKISREELAAHLKAVAKKEKLEIDDSSIDMVVTVSEGSVRDALSVLDKLSAYGKVSYKDTEKILGLTNVETSQKFFELISKKDAVNSLAMLGDLFSDGTDPIQFTRDFLEYLRKLLLTAMGAKQDFAIDPEQHKILQQQSKFLSLNSLLTLIRLFLRANKDFASSPNSELPVQLVVAEFCSAGGAPAMPASTASTSKAPDVTISVAPQSASAEAKQPDFKKRIDPIKEAVSAKLSDFTPVSYDQLVQEWPEIMKKLKQEASTLFAIMKNANLKQVQDNRITLTFVYKFHKDSLDSPRNREVLLKIIREHFNTGFLLEVLLEKPEESSGEDSAGLAMEVFG